MTTENTAGLVAWLPAFAAILAAVVALVGVHRQINAAARLAWMRELREHAATVLANSGETAGGGKRDLEMYSASLRAIYSMHLLIAEKDPRYKSLLPILSRYGNSEFPGEIAVAVADILRREGSRGLISVRRNIRRGLFRLWMVCSAAWLALVVFDAVSYWQPGDWRDQWVFSVRPHLEWAIGVPLGVLAGAVVLVAASLWVRAGFGRA